MKQKEVKKVLDFLQVNKHLNDEQYNELINKKFVSFSDLEKKITRKVMLSKEDLTKIKAIFFDMNYISLIGKNIDPDILNILPQDLSENYEMAVFAQEGKNVSLGLVVPSNFKAIEAFNYLARKNNFKVAYYVISEESYRTAIKQYETLSEEVGEALDTAETIFAPKEEDLPDITKGVGEVMKSAPVSKIVSVILRHAIEGRASDIHIEPVGKQSKVRYRIDGILHTTIVLPIYVHAAVVSRVKVMANLKIDETRIPQDGRIRIKVHNKDIDFRISTIPLMDQEKIVMRILDTPAKAPTFKDLGFLGLQAKMVSRNIKKPNGMFLVTGPTGSGKSTTLFSALTFLNKETINITTLEDPVEYYVAGVNQSQVKSEIGFTFAKGLRALLRQDPDIIMVGEIRDNETAELAIHAGLTGHFVLSTLHTNNAIGAIPRMFDMKSEPFLLASTLNLIIAQRLVRKICVKCKIDQTDVPKDIMDQIVKQFDGIPEEAFYKGINKNTEFKFFKGKGCDHCGNTGYKGRTSIVETIDITRNLKRIITEGFKRSEADVELDKQHFITMEQDGIIKSLLGITTIEEVLRVGQDES